MTRRRALLLLVTAVSVLGSGTELWIHTNFGINTPWDTPRHLPVCGRRYDQGPPLRDPQTTYTFYVHPTVFDLPVPIPDVSPIPGVMNWGGCPLQVVLDTNHGEVVYGFIQGGP